MCREMRRVLCLGLLLLVTVPAPAAECQLCAPKDDKSDRPDARRALRIEIDSVLDFSSIAIRAQGSGAVEIDSRSGTRRVSGGLIGLGGPALRGVARITGQPFARIAIRLPTTFELRSLSGATARISQIETTLSPDPMIGTNGELIFSFGGRMSVSEGEAGEFQGRFPISVEYQ
jgi:Domain of unknown function (DUF4402)